MILMVQAIINIKKHTNQVLNIIKAKHSPRDKSEAINLMATQYEKRILEPELRPEYIEKYGQPLIPVDYVHPTV